jgi:hypothetical protein
MLCCLYKVGDARAGARGMRHSSSHEQGSSVLRFARWQTFKSTEISLIPFYWEIVLVALLVFITFA